MTALTTSVRLATPRPAAPQLSWRVIGFVLLPFATGFYLSYLYRSINALLADHLSTVIGVEAAQLGLLTSIYLLVTAAAQIPVGALLDRYGPRRVQAPLLVVAAVGALLTAVAQSFWSLLLARALIGLGVATALQAGLKAAVTWVPRERLALANGILLGLGALGAVTATWPAEILIDRIGWRNLMLGLALLTLASAASLWLLVPESAAPRVGTRHSTYVELAAIARDLRFLRLAPIAGLIIGTSWALQGLWTARWLVDVDGFERRTVVAHLFIMALALSAGAFGLGWSADRLARRGWPAESVLAIVGAASIVAQLALLADAPLPAVLPWAVVGAAGAATVLSYSVLATYVPRELAGRANALLNLFHFGAAFAVQSGFGLIVALWPARGGHYPAEAYRAALAIGITLQSAALLWFLAGLARPYAIVYAASPPQAAAPPAVDYVAARSVWLQYIADACAQARCWRLAAIGSLAVSGSLVVEVAAAILDRPATVHVITVQPVGRVHAREAPKPVPAVAAWARASPLDESASLPANPLPEPEVVQSTKIQPLTAKEKQNVETNSRPHRRIEHRPRQSRRAAARPADVKSSIAARRHQANRYVGPSDTRRRLPVHRGDAGDRPDDRWACCW